MFPISCKHLTFLVILTIPTRGALTSDVTDPLPEDSTSTLEAETRGTSSNNGKDPDIFLPIENKPSDSETFNEGKMPPRNHTAGRRSETRKDNSRNHTEPSENAGRSKDDVISLTTNGKGISVLVKGEQALYLPGNNLSVSINKTHLLYKDKNGNQVSISATDLLSKDINGDITLDSSVNPHGKKPTQPASGDTNSTRLEPKLSDPGLTKRKFSVPIFKNQTSNEAKLNEADLKPKLGQREFSERFYGYFTYYDYNYGYNYNPPDNPPPYYPPSYLNPPPYNLPPYYPAPYYPAPDNDPPTNPPPTNPPPTNPPPTIPPPSNPPPSNPPPSNPPPSNPPPSNPPPSNPPPSNPPPYHKTHHMKHKDKYSDIKKTIKKTHHINNTD